MNEKDQLNHRIILGNDLVAGLLSNNEPAMQRYIQEHQQSFLLASFQLIELERIAVEKGDEFYAHWIEFREKFDVVKTPGVLDWDELKTKQNLGSYLLLLAAEATGAKVLTRDENLLAVSDLFFSPEDMIKSVNTDPDLPVSFLDLKSPHLNLFRATRPSL